tara:strand:- start:311 stop:598 length:288 start_codon:yes stop_codon:yes gene_type:complete
MLQLEQVVHKHHVAEHKQTMVLIQYLQELHLPVVVAVEVKVKMVIQVVLVVDKEIQTQELVPVVRVRVLQALQVKDMPVVHLYVELVVEEVDHQP